MNHTPSNEEFENILCAFIALPEDQLNDFFDLQYPVLLRNEACEWLQQKRANGSGSASVSPGVHELFLVRKAVAVLCLKLSGDEYILFFTKGGKFLLYPEAIAYIQVLKEEHKERLTFILFFETMIRLYQEQGLENVLTKLEYTFLGELVNAINSPEAAQNLSYKKQLLEQAIQFTRVNPYNTANNKAILGTILIKLPEGDHAQNIEEAITYLTDALAFFSRETYPVQWAEETNHLGRAYFERETGNREENLAVSIKYLADAASIQVPQENDNFWSSNNFNRGMVYEALGEEYWEQAIACYTTALSLYKKKQRINECAVIASSLGLLYYEKKTGSNQGDLIKSIAYYEESLQYNQALRNAGTCAVIQASLGISYSFLQEPDYEINIQKSIGHFKDAISFFEQKKNANALEDLYFEAGDAYLNFKNRNIDENIETAIDYFHKGLQLTNRDAPQTLVLFSIANIEEARSYQKLKQGLGEAFLYRLKGDRAHNLEMAIKYFNDSLLTYFVLKGRVSFAPLWNQFGIAHFERVFGDKKENLERAIEYYSNAIGEEEHGSMPWYAYHMNLGNAYRERIAGDPADNRNEAIKNIQVALEKITEESDADTWARCQHSLGNLFRLMAGEKDAVALEKAIGYYQNAIRARAHTNDFYALGQSYMAMSSSYLALEKLTPGSAFECSIAALLSASQQIDATIDPRTSVRIFYELGSIYYHQENWTSCIEALDKAHHALEELRAEIFSEIRRQDLSVSTVGLYNKLVYACLKVNDTEAAFNYVSSAKSRTLLDHMNAPADTIKSLVQKNSELAAAWKSVSELRAEIDNRVARLQSAGKKFANDKNERQTIHDEIKEKRRQLQQEVAAAFFSFPQLSSVQSAAAITLPQAKQLSASLHQSPLIEYYSTQSGWYAFIITADDYRCVPLSSSAEEAVRAGNKWLAAYEKGEAWAIKKTPDVLSALYTNFFEPFTNLLPQSGHLVLAPYLGLHSLPLELCRNAQGSYLSDQYTISYTPGLSVLNELYEQQSRMADEADQKRLLTVIYSASESSVPLKNVLDESAEIKKYFNANGSVYLEENNALPNLIIDACHEKQFDVIHIACHANFDRNDPLNSGLLLANGSVLSVERIQTELRLTQKPLVVLSACETGHNSARSADENLGLVQSFFAAGAGAVIASFWNVNDESTRQMFTEFYQRKNETENLAQTLNEAKNSLRKNAKWQQPFFWSAFRFSGLPFSKHSLKANTDK